MADAFAHEEEALLYQSGELGEMERRRFESHLPACASCRRILEEAAWGARLAEEAALAPRSDWLAAALDRTRGGAREEGRDWTRAAGWGLGFALAAGLLVFHLSRRASDHFPWRSGLEQELEQVGRDLDRMDAALSRDAWDVEFEQGWEELGRRERRLERELAKPEGA